MKQNRGSYHNITIRGIRSNLTEQNSCADKMKTIYYPPHKVIYENRIADLLTKVAAKKAIHLTQINKFTSSCCLAHHSKIG